jgi:hypothetical protein
LQLPTTDFRLLTARPSPFDRLRAPALSQLRSPDSRTSRPPPFDRLPSTGSLRRAQGASPLPTPVSGLSDFPPSALRRAQGGRLPSTGSLRQAQGGSPLPTPVSGLRTSRNPQKIPSFYGADSYLCCPFTKRQAWWPVGELEINRGASPAALILNQPKGVKHSSHETYISTAQPSSQERTWFP